MYQVNKINRTSDFLYEKPGRLTENQTRLDQTLQGLFCLYFLPNDFLRFDLLVSKHPV